MTSESSPSRVSGIFPIAGWIKVYPRSALRTDLIAGVVTSAVVIPQAMAYASLAGLPVEVGLYTALVALPVYAMLGTSPVLSVSVTSTIALITASTLELAIGGSDPGAYLGPAAVLAGLVGLLLVLAGLLRMGFLANFISLPVLTGFKAGIGLVILIGQLGKLTGVPLPRGGPFETVARLLANLDAVDFPTLALSAFSIAILLLIPKTRIRVPAALLAVATGIAAAALGLQVSQVGPIPPGVPAPALPGPLPMDMSLLRALIPGAVAIALISFTESIAAARAFARRGDPPVRANQELLALGASNLAAGLFQGFPAGGGTSQTAVNEDSGARSQLAGIVTALMVALTLLLLAPLISLLPEATLGALVAVAAVGLMKVAEFRAMREVRADEFWWAVIAFAGVVFIGTLAGILIAVIVSMLDIIRHSNHPPVYQLGRKPGTDVFRPLREHPDDAVYNGLLMLRTEGRLYFGNAMRFADGVRTHVEQSRPKVLLLDCGAVPDIEYTALNQLIEMDSALRAEGVELWLAALNPAAREVVERSPLGAALTASRVFPNVEGAVDRYSEAGTGSD